jgi:probable rRNA maturation factor
MTLAVEIQRRVRAWAPSRAEITAWAGAALGSRHDDRKLEVAVVGPAESRRLNSRYRRRDRPTNVLSFPAAPHPLARGSRPMLGDLVLCPQVLRAEAREQRKDLRSHWAHMIVHGSLHLIGFEHERRQDAERMERREVAVLRRLGFADPYRSS